MWKVIDFLVSSDCDSILTQVEKRGTHKSLAQVAVGLDY